MSVVFETKDALAHEIVDEVLDVIARFFVQQQDLHEAVALGHVTREDGEVAPALLEGLQRLVRGGHRFLTLLISLSVLSSHAQADQTGSIFYEKYQELWK